MRTITVEEFKEGAPERYAEVFSRVFPQGMELTRENIIRSFNEGIDTSWFLNIVLSPAELNDYDNTHAFIWYVDYEHIKRDLQHIQTYVRDRIRQYDMNPSWELIQTEEEAISACFRHLKRALVDIHIMYLLRNQNDPVALP